MKSCIYFLGLFILLIAAIQVEAKPTLKSHYKLTVVYGDNKSEFRLSNDSTVPSLEYLSSLRGSRKDVLSSRDYSFIHKKAAATLTLKNNEKSLCSRNFIELKGTFDGKSIEKLGCIGSKTEIAKKMTELANTLDLQVF